MSDKKDKRSTSWLFPEGSVVTDKSDEEVKKELLQNLIGLHNYQASIGLPTYLMLFGADSMFDADLCTESVVVSFYFNPDEKVWGFGFNERDGGGFMSFEDFNINSGVIITPLQMTVTMADYAARLVVERQYLKNALLSDTVRDSMREVLFQIQRKKVSTAKMQTPGTGH